MNSELFGSDCKAVARVQGTSNRLALAEVDVYRPDRSRHITIPGDWFGSPTGSENDIIVAVASGLNGATVELSR